MSTAENHLSYLASAEHIGEAPFVSTPEIHADLGSLLAAKTNTEPDMAVVDARIAHASPAKIALVILQEVGIAPQREVVEKHRTEAQALWTQTAGNIPDDQKEDYDTKVQIVRHADLLAERIKGADAYQQGLWDNYDKRTGQNIDKLMELYDDTDAFEDSSILQTVHALDLRLHQLDDRVKDAERILRYMLRNEARATAE